MKIVVVMTLLAAAAVGSMLVGQDKKEKLDKDLLAVKAGDIRWEKAAGMPEGVWVSHLTGEPAASPFVDMLKIARGTRISLHWHSANHIVTVMSGTIVFGKEGKPEETAGTEITAGGYARINARQPHWTMAKEDTILVVSGDKENDIHWMSK